MVIGGLKEGGKAIAGAKEAMTTRAERGMAKEREAQWTRGAKVAPVICRKSRRRIRSPSRVVP